jgi:uncharacterized membrane protein YgcG
VPRARMCVSQIDRIFQERDFVTCGRCSRKCASKKLNEQQKSVASRRRRRRPKASGGGGGGSDGGGRVASIRH